MMNQVTVAIITPNPPPPSPFILPAILPLADFNDDVIISLSHPPARPLSLISFELAAGN